MKRAVATGTAIAGANTAETVVLTLPGVPLPAEPGGLLVSHVIIDGFLNITTGTLVTAVTIRVRRGTTIAGALVGVAQVHSIGASANASVPFSADDPLVAAAPPAVPGQVYVVTAQQTAGTSALTTNYGVATATTS
jgi:hypothetical protein